MQIDVQSVYFDFWKWNGWSIVGSRGSTFSYSLIENHMG